ncbi:unnamed protein product [Paramecium pentaurelia]|uniref:Peptidase A1 domain-containing protein n=1 Tax=Paramecium pentaurelia TaxID=43138 RepID=A0A8S1UGG1_9CILI|nr:unnamed protein product [Paramecium pentaurelia]
MLIILYLFSLAICYDDPIHTSIIYGDSDQGYYYVNIFVGEHKQKQSLILDTASSITTFPCVDCKSCGTHIDSFYNYKNSQTHKQVKCDQIIGEKQCDKCLNNRCSFQISYAEGSRLAGYFLQDWLIMGDEFENLNQSDEIVKLEQVLSVIGCTTLETNLFFTQKANGIMGLSPKTNTEFSFPNYIDDLYEKEKGKEFQKMFSICIGRKDGYMTIGQYDFNRHQNNSQYYKVKYNHETDVYKINVNSIKIDNKIIADHNLINLGQGAFIDSGSTLAYGSPKLSEKLTQQFNCQNENCPDLQYLEGLNCYQYIPEKHENFSNFASYFPTYQFELDNNFTFNWKPINYLILAVNTSDRYCFPLAVIPGASRMILGQVWMRNWDIGFNKQTQEILFVENNCSNYKVNHQFTEEDIILLEQQSLKKNNGRRVYKDLNLKEKYNTFSETLYAFVMIVLIIFLYYLFSFLLKLKKKYGKYQTIQEISSQE